MEQIFEALNHAYILYSLIVGVYAVVLAAWSGTITGSFWGTMWLNTALAGAILVVALILTAMGKRPMGNDPDNPDNIIQRDVYYLYAIYFIISLPGVFTLSGGSDRRSTAIIYSGVAFFNAAAAYRAMYWLLSGWE